MIKTCKHCGLDKSASDFYISRPRKCKDCVRADVLKNRAENIDAIRAYDRERGSQPHRVAAREAYQRTPAGKSAVSRAKSSYMARNPERRAATTAVSNAIRDGILVKLPCEVCGATKRVEGHHPAYSMPLDVVWLCKPHHQQLHNEHDDNLRAAA